MSAARLASVVILSTAALTSGCQRWRSPEAEVKIPLTTSPDELTYREYNMPVIERWRFDGKTWSDVIDPGIFVR